MKTSLNLEAPGHEPYVKRCTEIFFFLGFFFFCLDLSKDSESICHR